MKRFTFVAILSLLGIFTAQSVRAMDPYCASLPGINNKILSESQAAHDQIQKSDCKEPMDETKKATCEKNHKDKDNFYADKCSTEVPTYKDGCAKALGVRLTEASESHKQGEIDATEGGETGVKAAESMGSGAPAQSSEKNYGQTTLFNSAGRSFEVCAQLAQDGQVKADAFLDSQSVYKWDVGKKKFGTEEIPGCVTSQDRDQASAKRKKFASFISGCTPKASESYRQADAAKKNGDTLKSMAGAGGLGGLLGAAAGLGAGMLANKKASPNKDDAAAAAKKAAEDKAAQTLPTTASSNCPTGSTSAPATGDTSGATPSTAASATSSMGGSNCPTNVVGKGLPVGVTPDSSEKSETSPNATTPTGVDDEGNALVKVSTDPNAKPSSGAFGDDARNGTTTIAAATTASRDQARGDGAVDDKLNAAGAQVSRSLSGGGSSSTTNSAALYSASRGAALGGEKPAVDGDSSVSNLMSQHTECYDENKQPTAEGLKSNVCQSVYKLVANKKLRQRKYLTDVDSKTSRTPASVRSTK